MCPTPLQTLRISSISLRYRADIADIAHDIDYCMILMKAMSARYRNDIVNIRNVCTDIDYCIILMKAMSAQLTNNTIFEGNMEFQWPNDLFNVARQF